MRPAVAIRVVSQPAAQVRLGDAVLGTTPLAVTIPEGQERVTVRLERPDHRPQDLVLERDGRQEVDVRLSRRQARKLQQPELAPR